MLIGSPIFTPITGSGKIGAYSLAFANMCIVFGTDGIWSGYDSSIPFGSVTHSSTGGLFFYSFKFKATGEFIMSFGVAGNEQMPDVYEIWATNRDGAYTSVLVWNAATSVYEAIDIPAAEVLLADTGTCLGFYALPELIIDYDYTVEVI